MSDSPFEDFCVSCDKVCSLNSLYCSIECKEIDEHHPRHNSTHSCLSHSTCNHNENDLDNSQSYTDHNLLDSLLMRGAYSTRSDVDSLDLNKPSISDTIMMTCAGHNYRKWLAMS